MAAARRQWWPVATLIAGLVAINVASNRVVPRGGYVAFAVASSAVLLAFAVYVDQRSWDELGLGPGSWTRGLRWGAVLVAIVAAVYLVGMAIPATRELFRDERVQGWDLRKTLAAAFIRVPLGTVLLEEVAFRGVVPAMIGARTKQATAVAVSAILFGLWHVLPSLGLQDVNHVTRETLGGAPGWVTTVSAVVSTALVGVWFWWLRHRSGSLLAPAALHWATNALGYLFAYWAWHG